MPKQEKLIGMMKQQPKWKNFLLILGVIIATLALLAVVLEVNYQARLQRMRNVNQQLSDEILRPLGGVHMGTYVKGEHFWDICIDTGPCPSISDSWLILVDDEAMIHKYILDHLKKNNYMISDRNLMNFGGVKDGISIRFGFYTPSKTPPYSAPPDKKWMEIGPYTTD